MNKKIWEKIKFIFTEESFYVDEVSLLDIIENEKIQEEFHQDKWQQLYELGFYDDTIKLSSSSLFLKRCADQFFQLLTEKAELELVKDQIEVIPQQENIQKLLHSIPFSLGSEFLNEAWIMNAFSHLKEIFAKEISQYHGSVQMYLAEKSQNLSVAQRIYFHLVDYDNHLFAFMATYATKDDDGHIRHLPLKHALIEFEHDRMKLIHLLSCLNQAAEVCPLIGELMENGEMFHPIQLNPKEAYQLLQCVPKIEKCGIMCRVPNWFKKKYSSISMQVTIGEKKPSLFGFDSLLSCKPQLMVNGKVMTKSEISALLKQEEGLVWMKGQWIEVNHHRLKELLDKFSHYNETYTLKEALQDEIYEKKKESDVEVTNGQWLSQLLNQLKNPKLLKKESVPKKLKAELRNYQKEGYTWLNSMSHLGFGACLADDMGLGKTIQVLAYLEKMMEKDKNARVLLIAPASLLGNWTKEIEKFTPSLSFSIYHGKSFDYKPAFLTITTYGMVARNAFFSEQEWKCVILDEAQAIKNPKTKQAKMIKKLKASMRIALTGTPIENDLSNLWSLFDFLNAGLLGSFTEFQKFGKSLDLYPERYDKLRGMIAPFILRRMKTDKTIISDLPDKIEVNDYVQLSKRQTIQYHALLDGLQEKLDESTGMERRGLILSTLTKLKQICNHPDQYVHDCTYLPNESGKFEMLKELCETIYEKRERVLIFTQYKEICDYLSDYLETIFHKKGFIIHGKTPIKKRNEIVNRFNSEEYCPYIVLSLRAAGTGLNLVSANHVIHFDRWWNPAVENQATDRAFRIGQKKNVIVHKLICKGTVEEKIDQLIESKKELSETLLSTQKENWITEMSNQQLLSLFKLD